MQSAACVSRGNGAAVLKHGAVLHRARTYLPLSAGSGLYTYFDYVDFPYEFSRLLGRIINCVLPVEIMPGAPRNSFVTLPGISRFSCFLRIGPTRYYT